MTKYLSAKCGNTLFPFNIKIYFHLSDFALGLYSVVNLFEARYLFHAIIQSWHNDLHFPCGHEYVDNNAWIIFYRMFGIVHNNLARACEITSWCFCVASIWKKERYVSRCHLMSGLISNLDITPPPKQRLNQTHLLGEFGVLANQN